METKILEAGKNKLVAELHGVGHTFCNALVAELWNDKDISVAAYNIDHPFIGIPKLIVETKSKNPKDALKDAIKRIQKDTKAFTKAFQKIK